MDEIEFYTTGKLNGYQDDLFWNGLDNCVEETCLDSWSHDHAIEVDD